MREIQRAVRKALDWYTSRCFQVPVEPSGVAIGFLRDELGRIPTPAETGEFELQWRAAQGDPWLLPHDLVITDEDGETRVRFPNRHEAAWEFGEEVRRRARRGGSYLLSIVMALVALALAGCSPTLWTGHAVEAEPGLEAATAAAVAGWNAVCPGLFAEGGGETRVAWAPKLAEDHVAEQRGFYLVISRDAYDTRPEFTPDDWAGVVGHELGHVVLPHTRFPGADGWGHYDGGVMQAARGPNYANETDRQALIAAGYDCTGGSK